jgi:gamma-glutamyl:cysteine ligase YbdK (ATP-grasp superfamily)
MNRLRNISETCPIYKEAEHLFDCLKDEIKDVCSEKELTEYLSERFTDYAKSILECVDRCRDISGELRETCVERGEKIQELEEKLGNLISA